MAWSLEGRSTVCLAASQGLGLGIATEMVRAGAQTLLVSRNRERLEQAADRVVSVLEQEGPYPGIAKWHPPELFPIDLLSAGASVKIVEAAVERFEALDVLVYNIGGPRPGRLEQLRPGDWLDGYDQLIRGFVEHFQAALPWLRRSTAPRALVVTSSSARQPIPGLLLSNTFRAGVVGLVKSLAHEYAAEGILVNNLAPGMFDTDRLRELDTVTAREREITIEEARQQRLQQIPIGRYGDPRELGRAAVFLASAANSMITGQTILVDGGLYKGL
ncbi:MAG: SDR family oxidoreductase [Candidatus Eisenbacteria bacterium]|uniref:SDR family oxidoreductase n=1 Tax=Eiseniibacteriota bacterium TaxID=2212470 RepID=A0A956RPU6_UNCEI|nr:SDR family oxidoreductase [Candidatus Eisenbacteria bacterium]